MFLVTAATAAFSKLMTAAMVYAITIMGDLDPFLPEDGARPRGSGAVIRIFGVVLSWILLFAALLGLVYAGIALINALRNRGELRDVGKPVFVTLLALSFGAILGIVSGAFNGIIGAA